MKVLVTGATGFIGSHLLHRLLARGDRVRVLVRSERDASELAVLGAETVRGDVRDPSAVAEAVADREIVYHLAKAHSSSTRSTTQSVNVGATAILARAVEQSGVARLVHASSAAVYGSMTANQPLREDCPLRPQSQYARSKSLAEEILRSEYLRVGLPVVLARISSVLGPGALRWRSLFEAIAQKRFWSPGPGTNHHHLVDVSDIVEGVLLCGRTPGVEGRAYNLAGSESVTLQELIQLIARELDMPAGPRRTIPAGPLLLYQWLNDSLGKVAGLKLPRADGISTLMNNRILDISRARQELGYHPSVGVVDAIHRTAEWYRMQGYLPRVRSKDPGAPEHAAL
jgi:dihydroflavonol-4-reductase